MYIIYHIICLSRHYLLNNHSPGNHAQNKILPRYHATLHFFENLPENLVGGLAAPCLYRGQLLIIPAKKENLTFRSSGSWNFPSTTASASPSGTKKRIWNRVFLLVLTYRYLTDVIAENTAEIIQIPFWWCIPIFRQAFYDDRPIRSHIFSMKIQWANRCSRDEIKRV